MRWGDWRRSSPGDARLVPGSSWPAARGARALWWPCVAAARTSSGAPSSWCRIPQLPFPPDARSSPRLCARALCTRPPLPRLFNPKRRRAWPSAFDRATTCTSTVLKIRATAATAIPRGRCGLGRSRSAPRRAIPRGRGGTSIWIWIRATRDARRSRQCKLRAPPPPRPPRPPLFGGAPLPRPRPRHLSCRCLSGPSWRWWRSLGQGALEWCRRPCFAVPMASPTCTWR
mmetsp:Transcript_34178/g.65295  ORF Transcript_34178/g.65295 Transcript_34178/m.65295 type:complete len:229 (+) Transcript_34178:561-1247(+)